MTQYTIGPEGDQITLGEDDWKGWGWSRGAKRLWVVLGKWLAQAASDQAVVARAAAATAAELARVYRDQAAAIALVAGTVLDLIVKHATGVGTRPDSLPTNDDLPPFAVPGRSTRWGIEVAAGITLASHHRGMRLWVTQSGVTITLPGAADEDLDNDWDVEIANASAGAITIARAGTDTVNGAISIVVAAGARVIVQRLSSSTFRSA